MSRFARPFSIGVGLLVSASGVAACVDLNANPQAPTVWDTQLVPATTFPDISGEGAAVSQADGTSLGISIHGATPAAQHVWALRLGTCAAPGQQVGLDASYPVLTADAAGDASGQTHFGTMLSASASYHLAVRLSASDTTRIACGDLTLR